MNHPFSKQNHLERLYPIPLEPLVFYTVGDSKLSSNDTTPLQDIFNYRKFMLDALSNLS